MIILDIFALPTNLTQITEVFTAAGSFTQGALGVGILIIVFFGTLFLTATFRLGDSLIASSFVSMIISMFLRYLGLIGDFFMFLTGIFFIISLVLSAQKTSQGT